MLSYVHGAGAVLFFTPRLPQADQTRPSRSAAERFSQHALVTGDHVTDGVVTYVAMCSRPEG